MQKKILILERALPIDKQTSVGIAMMEVRPPQPQHEIIIVKHCRVQTWYQNMYMTK